MPYTINNANGSFLVTVNDLVSDKTATSLTLPARGVATYGADVAENFVYLLQNFASTSAPARAIPGQLWFDASANVMRQFFGGSWSQVSPDGFGTTADTLVGTTIGGFNSSTNRIAGSTGYPISYGGSTTTINVMTGEGVVIAVASTEAIPVASLPTTIVLQNRSFAFKARFPNGIVAGMTLATDAAGYSYAGSNQFSNLLGAVPYLLSGDDTSGTVNHLAIAVPAVLGGYSKYLTIESKVANTNTGAVVMAVNSLGEVPVLRRSGVPLSAGDLIQGFYYRFIHDGTEFRVDDAQANGYVGPTGPQGIQGPQGAASTVAGPQGPAGGAGPAGTPSVYVASDSNQSINDQTINGVTTTTIVLNTTPTLPSSVPDNYMVVFSPSLVNTGPATINGIPLLRGGAVPLQTGDLQPNTRVIAVSDGQGNLIHHGLTYGEVQRVVTNAVLYVDVHGSDTAGTGSQGQPFLTVTHALNYAQNNLSFPGGILIKLVSPGTYDIPEYFPTMSSSVTILGDDNNQASYTVTRSSATVALVLVSSTILTLRGVTLVNPGVNNVGTVIATNGSTVALSNVTCAVAAGQNMGSGSVLQINSNSSIGLADGCIFSGNAPQGAWVFSNGGSFGCGNLSATPATTVTFNGTPQYGYTVIISSLSQASFLTGLNFNGPVQANQYAIQPLGVLNLSGHTLPGQSTYSFNKGVIN